SRGRTTSQKIGKAVGSIFQRSSKRQFRKLESTRPMCGSSGWGLRQCLLVILSSLHRTKIRRLSEERQGNARLPRPGTRLRGEGLRSTRYLIIMRVAHRMCSIHADWGETVPLHEQRHVSQFKTRHAQRKGAGRKHCLSGSPRRLLDDMVEQAIALLTKF